jgi:ArsR family transcriptional regulator
MTKGRSQRTAGDDELRVPVAALKAEMFKALGHPVRVRVLELLTEREHSVGELQAAVGIEASHLSQQLGVLRRANLVSTRREGASVVYALRDPQVGELLAVAKQVLIRSLTESQDLLAGLRAGSS